SQSNQPTERLHFDAAKLRPVSEAVIDLFQSSGVDAREDSHCRPREESWSLNGSLRYSGNATDGDHPNMPLARSRASCTARSWSMEKPGRFLVVTTAANSRRSASCKGRALSKSRCQSAWPAR